MIETPSVRRRLIGGSLRRHRESLGLQLEDAARVLDCDRSKICRIETGQRGIRPKELRELLTEYGVGEAEQDTLSAIAHPRGDRGWWQDYAHILPVAVRDYLALEMTASQILVYEAQRVPPLLQTEDYARAIANAEPGVPEDMHDLAVDATLTRQWMILDARRPALDVVIGEAVLHQAVGGAELMRAQLRRLADAADECPEITIRVLPFASGAHAASGSGPLAILRFADAPGLGVVHLGGASGGVCLEGPADVACHLRAFGQLSRSALTPPESARLLREHVSESGGRF